MGDYAVAYILAGVISLVMLFCFLRMHEYLKQMNEKLSKTNELLEKLVNEKKS